MKRGRVGGSVSGWPIGLVGDFAAETGRRRAQPVKVGIEDEEDEYTHALQAVVEAKAAGLEPPHAPEAKVLPPAGGVSDLIAVLEAVVAKAEEEHPKATGKRPARKTAAKRTPKPEGQPGPRGAR